MAIHTITVSELKCACLDPEWRRQWLNGEKPSSLLLNQDKTPVYGNKFHQIVEKFVDRLIKDKTHRMAKADELILWQDMYERFAEKVLSELLESGKVEASYHLSQCLKSFCHRLIELRDRTPSFQTWQDIFVTKEYLIKDIKFQFQNKIIFVTGQIDAVRTHPTYGLEIVDYKLSHGDHTIHDLLQIAIYSKLLHLTKPGLKFHGTLEYYEPQVHETPVTISEMEEIFDSMVLPVLEQLASDIGSSKNFGITKEKSSNPSKADRFSQKIIDTYESFKLKVEIIDKHEAPQVIRYKIKPAAGVKVVSLVNRAEDLQVALSLKYRPIIEPAKGCVTIDIPKDQPDTVSWKDIVKHPTYTNHPSVVSFPIGIGIDNDLIIGDLADPNMCHVLIGGAPGSGKSEFLKTLVASLIFKNINSHHSQKTLRLTLIDPKLLTFGSLTTCSYLAVPVVTNITSAISRLQRAVSEMEQRYFRLNEEGFENLSDRFKSGKTDIPFEVIIFDEFSDLVLSGKEEKKIFETLVVKLSSKGRAAGIHLVLTTQRPDSKIVTGLIKANLPLKICLRVTTSVNSQIILDQTGGESLMGRGDLLCDRGKGIERAQAPYIPHEELLTIAQ